MAKIIKSMNDLKGCIDSICKKAIHDTAKEVEHVRLTHDGLQICLSVRETIVETERKLFSGLTPEEQNELNRLLYKVYHSIK